MKEIKRIRIFFECPSSETYNILYIRIYIALLKDAVKNRTLI